MNLAGLASACDAVLTSVAVTSGATLDGICLVDMRPVSPLIPLDLFLPIRPPFPSAVLLTFAAELSLHYRPTMDGEFNFFYL